MLTRSDLFLNQHRIADFVKSRDNAALFVPMGGGKTVSCLTGFNDMRRDFDARRALVIAPLRVARRVWSDEIRRWSHLQDLTVSKIIGTPEQRMRALRTPADVHTINREQIPWLYQQFIQSGVQTVRWPWDITFNDESQGFKNQSSERHLALMNLRWGGVRGKQKRMLFPRMVNMSGTPAPNGYADLWGQFRLLDCGHRLGADEAGFRERFFLPPEHQYARWRLRDKAAEEIHRLIADITLSLPDVEGPPVRVNYIRVGLSAVAMAKYKELERKFLVELFSGKTVTAVNGGVCAGKLAQLANGAIYINDGQWEPLHDEKLKVLPEIVESANGMPVMLVYGYKHDYARMAPVLDKMGLRWSLLQSDRQFDQFRDGELDVGVLHPASAGHGLNDLHLSGSETIVHFGTTNNWELYDQVNGRLTGGYRRVGKNVVIHRIIAEGTIDEKWIRLLDEKRDEEDTLMESLAKMAGVL